MIGYIAVSDSDGECYIVDNGKLCSIPFDEENIRTLSMKYPEVSILLCDVDTDPFTLKRVPAFGFDIPIITLQDWDILNLKQNLSTDAIIKFLFLINEKIPNLKLNMDFYQIANFPKEMRSWLNYSYPKVEKECAIPINTLDFLVWFNQQYMLIPAPNSTYERKTLSLKELIELDISENITEDFASWVEIKQGDMNALLKCDNVKTILNHNPQSIERSHFYTLKSVKSALIQISAEKFSELSEKEVFFHFFAEKIDSKFLLAEVKGNKELLSLSMQYWLMKSLTMISAKSNDTANIHYRFLMAILSLYYNERYESFKAFDLTSVSFYEQQPVPAFGNVAPALNKSFVSAKVKKQGRAK